MKEYFKPGQVVVIVNPHPHFGNSIGKVAVVRDDRGGDAVQVFFNGHSYTWNRWRIQAIKSGLNYGKEEEE